MSAVHRDIISLIRDERWAALATLHDSAPLASMVAYAVEPDLRGLLIFVSQLAAHTRNLVEDPRCSVAITRPDRGDGDPQLLERVSLACHAEPIPRGDEAFATAAAIYAERFPDALPRFHLGDFHLFRLVIDEARHVGGFARAATVSGDELRATAQAMAPSR